MSIAEHIFPIVMAGGSGTRFWPLSRKKLPKQFLALSSSQPLIVETVERLGHLADPRRTRVVCGGGHVRRVRQLLPRLPAANVVVEPEARNTAPAIGLAALHVAHADPQGILLVLPSDHHVAQPEVFQQALIDAAQLAHAGWLTTIGIAPTRPDTGYGYVELAGPIAGGPGGAQQVARFVEKPDRERAEAYLQGGKHLWNAGIFALRADVLLEQIRLHLPGLHGALEELRPTIGTRRYGPTLKAVFGRAEATSIDYGVMERATRIACVPGRFGWSDVGSFAALPEVRPVDAAGNVVDPDALCIDSSDCVVLSSGRPVVVVGMRGVVVVDAGDTVLVVPRDRAQDVRKAVDALQRAGRTGVL